MKQLRFDWISVPIMLLAAVLVVGFGWLVLRVTVNTFYSAPGNRLADWVEGSVRPAVRTVFDTGPDFDTPGPGSHSNGILIGMVDNEADRDRVLKAPPFINCPEGCEAWHPYEPSGNKHSVIRSALGTNDPADRPPDHARQIARAATEEDGARCAIRYARPADRASPDEPKEASIRRDVMCLSPRTGAFVYAYQRGH